MTQIQRCLFGTLALALMGGPFAPHSPVVAQDNVKEVAVINTDFGEIWLEMWPDVAPKTVANFKKLAGEGFYDGQCFHRIIDGFMIQGGDPLTKDDKEKAAWGTGGPGYNIDAEFNDRKHVRGVISMARSQDPNSAGSQFFICLGDVPQLDGQYTAFGNLVGGDEVLGKIGKVETTASRLGGEKSSPTSRVNIKSIRFEKRDLSSAGKK